MEAKAALDASSFEARSVTKASIDCWIKTTRLDVFSETSWKEAFHLRYFFARRAAVQGPSY